MHLDDGWTWSFDPAASSTPAAGRPDLGVALARLQVRVAMVAGSASQIVVPEERERLAQLAQRPGRWHRVISGGTTT